MVFALPRAERARISVIDIVGRRVRDLGEGNFVAGAHVLSWDGRDDSGRPTPAGAYFVRVEGRTSARVARVTRLR